MKTFGAIGNIPAGTLELKVGRLFATAALMNMEAGETLLRFQHVVTDDGGFEYAACARGRAMDDGMWEGWVEFEPVRGGPSLLTGRETIQPNHVDAVYWATGLTHVYLEGALVRALDGRMRLPASPRGGERHAGGAASKIINSQ